MKSRFHSAFLSYFIVVQAWASPAQQPQPPSSLPEQGRKISLGEAYRLALNRSELIAQDAESVAQALARVDELKSAILPHLSLTGSEILQESPNTGSGLSSINRTSIPQAQITLQQPLFSGFREFLAFQAQKKQAQSAALDQRRAEGLLYQDVAQSYLDLLRLQKELEIRRSIIDASKDRIRQLEDWVRIGRSRPSEGLAAQSQLAQVQAQLEISRGQEQTAQEVLRFLTGQEGRFVPQDVPVPAIEPLETFVNRARRRPDVEARRRDLEYAEISTEIARRQRWPTIGAAGDYYLKRTGFSENVHYDALFSLSLPVWDGGVISAQVREAQARQRSSEQTLSLAVRGAERDVRSAYRNLEWTLSAAQALQKAADLAQSNLKAQSEDYRLGLVTNLDVLDSLNTLELTRLTLNQVQQQAALACIQLEVAAGTPQENKK